MSGRDSYGDRRGSYGGGSGKKKTKRWSSKGKVEQGETFFTPRRETIGNFEKDLYIEETGTRPRPPGVGAMEEEGIFISSSAWC